MVVCWAEVKSSVVEVGDKSHWIMNVTNEESLLFFYYSRQVDFGGEMLVQYHRMLPDQERMRISMMGNPPTLLHDRTYEDRNWNIYKVDGQFIVKKVHAFRPIFQTLYFISTKNLPVFTSLSLIHRKIRKQLILL